MWQNMLITNSGQSSYVGFKLVTRYSTRPKKIMPSFGTLFQNALQRSSCRKSEGFFPKLEGFFRRALGSYTHRFLKCGAASLTDLPGLHLSSGAAFVSCVCNRKAEQQLKDSQIRVILKTRTVPTVQWVLFHLCWVSRKCLYTLVFTSSFSLCDASGLAWSSTYIRKFLLLNIFIADQQYKN